MMKHAFGLIAATAVLLGLSAPASQATEKHSGKKVILIMADDVGVEAFAAYGGTSYKTPAIDQLAAEGTLFENMHSQPLCTPTRVKIMSGQHNYRNYERFAYMRPDIKTFGNFAKEQGYSTMISGKWQLLRHKFEPTSLLGMQPSGAGFDEHFLWQLFPEYRGPRYWNPVFFHNGTLKYYNEQDYGPTLANDAVLEFVERKTNEREPFFVYYPMMLPHSPWVTTPDHPNAEGKQARFSAMLEYMDKMVGRVRQKVLDLGIEDDTVIIFTGDNGTNQKIVSQQSGKTVRGGKGTTLDTGTHVPFIAWGADVQQGKRDTALLDFADILPSVVELVGGTIPADHVIDGESFVHLFKGEQKSREDMVFIHYDSKWHLHDKDVARYAFTQRWKLYETGEFYDVQNDPDQKNPLKDAALSAEAKAIKAKLAAFMASKGNSKDFGVPIVYEQQSADD